MLMKPVKLGQRSPCLRILRVFLCHLFKNRKGFIELLFVAKVKCMLQFVLHQSFYLLSD